MTMPAWARNGVVGGGLAFLATLLANLVVLIPAPRDLCRVGPLIIPAAMFAGFLVFVALAGMAGFATARGTKVNPDAALSGLLVGAISGCALIALILLMPALTHRTQALASICPDVSGFGGPLSFNFGTPPPGFVMPTLPPGVPTPPAGFIETPPPGAIVFGSGGFGPTGIVGVIFQLVGVAFATVFGIAVATGVAVLAGMMGAATRRPAS